MKLNILGFAVPIFLLFMLIEYLVARSKQRPYFRLHNSLANISVGIAERLLDVFITGSFFFLYDFLHGLLVHFAHHRFSRAVLFHNIRAPSAAGAPVADRLLHFDHVGKLRRYCGAKKVDRLPRIVETGYCLLGHTDGLL
jgi:hypothetical protein